MQVSGGVIWGVMAPQPLARLDALVQEAIANRVFPGAVVCCGTVERTQGRQNHVSRAGFSLPPFMPHFARAYGNPTFESTHVPVKDTSVFDVASLTKVMATTAAIMLLVEQQLVALDDAVAKHLPWFGEQGKQDVTILHCLQHTSGMRACFSLWERGARGLNAAREALAAEWLRHQPGEGPPVYSDLGMIALGFLVEAVSGESLDVYTSRRVYAPLCMTDTGFASIDFTPPSSEGEGDGAGGGGGARTADNRSDSAEVPSSSGVDPWPLPERAPNSRIIPTEAENIRGRLLWGEVHDLNAYLMGGVAGHAGLFTSARDTTKFAACLLNGGQCALSGRRIFAEETVEKFFGTSAPAFSCGWDTRERSRSVSRSGFPSCGNRVSVKAFGHLGFTGCSLWLDPKSMAFVLLFSNAVHPTSEDGSPGERIIGLRPAVADAAMEILLSVRRPPLLPRRGASLILVPRMDKPWRGDRTHAMAPAPFTHAIEDAPEVSQEDSRWIAIAESLRRVATAAVDAGIAVALWNIAQWLRRRSKRRGGGSGSDSSEATSVDELDDYISVMGGGRSDDDDR